MGIFCGIYIRTTANNCFWALSNKFTMLYKKFSATFSQIFCIFCPILSLSLSLSLFLFLYFQAIRLIAIFSLLGIEGIFKFWKFHHPFYSNHPIYLLKFSKFFTSFLYSGHKGNVSYMFSKNSQFYWVYRNIVISIYRKSLIPSVYKIRCNPIILCMGRNT